MRYFRKNVDNQWQTIVLSKEEDTKHDEITIKRNLRKAKLALLSLTEDKELKLFVDDFCKERGIDKTSKIYSMLLDKFCDSLFESRLTVSNDLIEKQIKSQEEEREKTSE